ncbi:MAG: S8 family serine peptidase [Kiloniellaceae bacterium]
MIEVGSICVWRWTVAAALLWAPAAVPAAAAPSQEAARRAIEAVAEQLCPDGLEDTEALERQLPGYALTDVEDAGPSANWLRREIRLVASTADLAVVATGLQPGGALRRLDIEVRALGDDRPLMLALADGMCRILQARALRYGNGRATTLLLLASDMQTVVGEEPLDPAVPPGEDATGVTVALVDSGVNYLLPQIAARLARDPEGEILGYDFWDLDPRPFDGDTGRSEFFPIRHGSEVASRLLAEAPDVRLVPFRYPRPDMTRMDEVVARAAEAGAIIVALPLGSRNPDDWSAFAAAAKIHADILFIASAGNDGRDIDAMPVYPAALPLDNVIVVTSAEDDGRLARGSNWGAVSVDLLVPAENLAVTGFHGNPVRGSGSSFAVPRVAALAARLQAAHPGWRAAELKAAIFARAEPPPQAPGTVAVGWLPEAVLQAD